jgi:hypothetical protein
MTTTTQSRNEATSLQKTLKIPYPDVTNATDLERMFAELTSTFASDEATASNEASKKKLPIFCQS